MLYKDTCNRKSNQQNLGTIRSSNLCTEIIEYTAPDEVAVCNLASISLPRFLVRDHKSPSGWRFDFEELIRVTKVITKNLNRIIDINYYPVPAAEKSNKNHRPIGLGVQGMADTFITLRLPYESEAAQRLNLQIFATIYYAACLSSCEIAQVDGPYSTYQGSPVSKGLLQYDMWGVTQPETVNGLLKWDELKAKIKQYGIRNSLLVAPMPTASTSQILGNNESFEPYTSNLYVRRTLAGDFICATKRLLKDLIERGLWSESLKAKLMAANGSVQHIPEIPQDLRELYKTVWEMNGKTLIQMAAARGAYIDQSQSFNVHMTDVTQQKLTAMHFFGWRSGLKTGLYYLRTRAATDAIKFTLDPEVVKAMQLAQQQQHTVTPNTVQLLQPIAATPEVTGSGMVVPTIVASTSIPHTTTNGLLANPPTTASVTALAPPDMNATSVLSHGSTNAILQHQRSSVLQPRYPLQAKAPTTKEQREKEEEENIARWRRERENRKNQQNADDGEGCTMCSG
eukprot:UN02760